MSKHDEKYLHNNERVGFGVKAWWLNAKREAKRIKDGLPASHYAGAVPLGEVRRLFDTVQPVSCDVTYSYVDSDGNTVTILDPSRQGIVNRTDGTPFGVFRQGSDWQGHSKNVLDTISTMVGGVGDLGIDSAGLLGFGATAYVSVSIPESLHNDKVGIEYRPRLVFAQALDGSMALTGMRIVGVPLCDNTLAAELAGDGARVKVKHTKNAAIKIATAGDALGILDQTGQGFGAGIETLAEMAVNDRQWDAILDEVCKPGESKRSITMASNKRDAISTLYVRDHRCAPWQGTAFGAVQTLNTYAQHVAPRYSGDADPQAVRFERNLADVLSGKSAEADRSAVDLVCKVLATV